MHIKNKEIEEALYSLNILELRDKKKDSFKQIIEYINNLEEKNLYLMNRDNKLQIIETMFINKNVDLKIIKDLFLDKNERIQVNL